MGRLSVIPAVVALLVFTRIGGGLSVAASETGEISKPIIIQHVDSLLQWGLADSAISILEDRLASTGIQSSSDRRMRAALLASLADCHCQLAHFDLCTSLRLTADSLWRSEFGPESHEAAMSQLALGSAVFLAGNDMAALDYQREAQRIMRLLSDTLGADYAMVLSDIGWSLQYLNRYGEAEANLQRALDILNSAANSDTSAVLNAYIALGWVYVDTLPSRTDSLLECARSLVKNDSDRYRSELSNLWMCDGQSLLNRSRLTDAEHALSEAVRLKRLFYRGDNPEVASAEARLAQVYRKESRLQEAEQCLERTLAYYEECYPPEHPMIAYERTSLALVYKDEGKISQAEKNYRLALESVKKNFGEDHSGVTTLLHNLAELYRISGRLEEAERLFREVLQRRLREFGPDDANTAHSLTKLGLTNFELGDFAVAESLLTKALEIEQRSYGSESEQTTSAEFALAKVNYAVGQYDHARALAEHSLTVLRASLPPSNPKQADCLALLGDLSAQTGDLAAAAAYFHDAVRIKHDFVNKVYTYACTDQKARYLAQYPLILDDLLEQASRTQDSTLTNLAYEMVLNGRAKIVDMLATEASATRCSVDPEIHHLTDRHAQICTDISAFTLDNAPSIAPDVMRERLENLYEEKDSLELLLNNRCDPMRNRIRSQRWIPLTDVADALPANALLLEYVKYRVTPVSASAAREGFTSGDRYLLFTIDHRGKVLLHDVGSADSLDVIVESLRANIAASGSLALSAVGNLYEQQLLTTCHSLSNSLIPKVGIEDSAPRRLFIVPDGALNSFPFEILMIDDSSYLIEHVPLSYLMSGRELLGFSGESRRHNEKAVVLADPQFGLSEQWGDEDASRREGLAGGFGGTIRKGAGSDGCLGEGFTPLPGAAEEARLICDELERSGIATVTSLLGSHASRTELLASLPGPDILHVSTHSFYCADDEESSGNRFADALVHSGLALAGANNAALSPPFASTDRNDGVLTALEIVGLDLENTDLVVLSSCRSGSGKVVDNEGAVGLRYAVEAAGARSALVSLWNIPDDQTVPFMDEFYQQWLSGVSKSLAHQHACKKLISDSRRIYGHSHPLLWAGFILVGSPD